VCAACIGNRDATRNQGKNSNSKKTKDLLILRKVKSLWHEYPVPTDFNKQKELIRKLRAWIQQLENAGLIVGFAFNHYYSDQVNPNEPDELRIRFQYSDERNREIVESELENEVKELLPDYVQQERSWVSDIAAGHVLQAYEFGSRCAFLAWEQIENGRFPESYFDQASILKSVSGVVAKRIPMEFQTLLTHSIMNSLGIPKSPDERAILIKNLMHSTNSTTKEELINWLQKKWIEF
jgi:hypothetical protein